MAPLFLNFGESHKTLWEKLDFWKKFKNPSTVQGISNHQIDLSNILLTSSNNQISEFRVPNIYNKILFILFFAWSKVGPTVSSAIYNPL